MSNTTAVVFIPLTRGKIAVIDFDDFEKVRPYSWCAARCGRNRVYAVSGTSSYGNRRVMHRLILDAPPGMDVDHIDGDGLNNCRSNIRVCSRAQNAYSSISKKPDSTSAFRGVAWDAVNKKWRARIHFKRIEIHLGRFSNEIEAAKAYDKKAKELFGEYAAPNFPL